MRIRNKHRIRSCLFGMDGNLCHYCHTKLNGKTATIDHIIPLSNGGTNDLINLVLCCFWCNILKSNKDYNEFKAIMDRYVKYKSIVESLRNRNKHKVLSHEANN